jgi:hypothetical protein
MSQTPSQETKTVGGYLPPSASRTRAGGSSPGFEQQRHVGPPPNFAVDAIDAHGPIQSATSPLTSRRRSQPSSGANTPTTSIRAANMHTACGDPYADLRASKAAFAAIQPGRLSYVSPPLAGQAPGHAPEVPLSPTLPANLTVEGDDEMEEEVAPLPLLPTGRVLLINCLTNYGDPHFIGLAGLDIFDARGNRVELRHDHIFGTPEPAPTTDNGPDKIVERPHNTTDEGRMWLVPFTKGENHVVVVVLPSETQLALVRLWNYNASRVHSTRGARLVELTLDDRLLFRGELRQATGEGGPQAADDNAETFVLTEDTATLERIAAALEADLERDLDHDDRREAALTGHDADHGLDAPGGFMSVSGVITSPMMSASTAPVPVCTSLTLEFLNTWGNDVVVGLSAVRLLDEHGEDIDDVAAALEVPEEHAHLFAPAEEATVDNAGAMGGSTPLSALFDADPTTAWFARLVPGLKLRLDLGSARRVSAIMIANAGIFDLSCGARAVRIVRDRAEVLAEDLVLRKTPASLRSLLFQTIRLSDLLAAAKEGATVRSSITARAAIGLRRAIMLQQAWPEFYAPNAPAVAVLPIGYTFTLCVRIIDDPERSQSPKMQRGDEDPNDGDAHPANLPPPLLVRKADFLDEDSDGHSDHFFATVPTASIVTGTNVYCFEGGGVPGHESVLINASDDPRCLYGMAVDLELPPRTSAELTVLVDDAPVFQGLLRRGNGATVIPFTRDAAFLARHRDELYTTAV